VATDVTHASVVVKTTPAETLRMTSGLPVVFVSLICRDEEVPDILVAKVERSGETPNGRGGR
jgi:hypothetical protein